MNDGFPNDRERIHYIQLILKDYKDVLPKGGYSPTLHRGINKMLEWLENLEHDMTANDTLTIMPNEKE